MLRFVVRRLILVIPILLGLSILVFFWIRALPGSPATTLLGERATNRSVVWAEGPSPLARVLSGVAFGDLVSVYLAILYQTDPTPVTLLAMLKQRLARSTD